MSRAASETCCGTSSWQSSTRAPAMSARASRSSSSCRSSFAPGTREIAFWPAPRAHFSCGRFGFVQAFCTHGSLSSFCTCKPSYCTSINNLHPTWTTMKSHTGAGHSDQRNGSVAGVRAKHILYTRTVRKDGMKRDVRSKAKLFKYRQLPTTKKALRCKVNKYRRMKAHNYLLVSMPSELRFCKYSSPNWSLPTCSHRRERGLFATFQQENSKCVICKRAFPTRATVAPSRFADTHWFAPLPPKNLLNRCPITVSPGFGSPSVYLIYDILRKYEIFLLSNNVKRI